MPKGNTKMNRRIRSGKKSLNAMGVSHGLGAAPSSEGSGSIARSGGGLIITIAEDNDDGGGGVPGVIAVVGGMFVAASAAAPILLPASPEGNEEPSGLGEERESATASCSSLTPAALPLQGRTLAAMHSVQLRC